MAGVSAFATGRVAHPSQQSSLAELAVSSSLTVPGEGREECIPRWLKRTTSILVTALMWASQRVTDNGERLVAAADSTEDRFLSDRKAEGQGALRGTLWSVYYNTEQTVPADECPYQDSAGECPCQDSADECPCQDSASKCPCQDSAGVCPCQDSASKFPCQDSAGVCPCQDSADICPCQDFADVCPCQDSAGEGCTAKWKINLPRAGNVASFCLSSVTFPGCLRHLT